MAYKQIVLKVLYFSLGIAALAGFTALFAGVDSDLIGRLIGTSILTAVTTGLLLLSIKYYDSEISRAISICISVLTYFAYFFFIAAIWCYLINGDSEIFMASGFIVLGTATPLLIGASLMGIERSKFAGLILVVIWSILTIWWVVNVMSNVRGVSPNTYYTPPIAIYGSMFAIMCLLKRKTLIVVGAIPLLIAFFTAESIAHFSISNKESSIFVWKLALFTSWLAASLSIPNILFFRVSKYQVKVLEIATTLLIVLALGFIAILLYFGNTQQEIKEWHERLASGFAILATAGTLGTLVWQTIQVYMIPKADQSFILEIDCPRCRSHIGLRQGKNHCPCCNLFLQINFESPNCPSCQYDLIKSESNTCPECGYDLFMKFHNA